MKKLCIGILAVVCIALSVSSCKKYYTCKCTVAGGKYDTSIIYYSKKTSRQATDDCTNAQDALNYKYTGFGTISCALQ